MSRFPCFSRLTSLELRVIAAFLNSDRETSLRAAQRHSAKTRHLTRHLTLHGTPNRHRQHLPARNGPPLILKWAQAHFSFPKKTKMGPSG